MKAVVISGPSGVGKTTLIKKLFNDPKLKRKIMFSVSHTTRKPRKGEKHGKHYFFVSHKKFMGMVREGEFIEWAKVHGNLYGTSIQNIKKADLEGKILILDIDVQGAEQVKRKMGKDAFLIFIKPPSLEELEKRLENRKDTPKNEIKKRLKNTQKEMQKIYLFDRIIVNDKIEKTFSELKSEIEKILNESKASDKKQIITLIKDLVSIESVSGREREVQLFIEKKLKDIGIPTKRQYIDKARFNIFAGDFSSPHFLISAHVDTVPSLGMKNAFNPIQIKGKIFGRGSADAKGGIASLLHAISTFISKSHKLKKIIFCFTVDEEEWSSYGSEKAIEFLPSSCKEAIVIEPTNMIACIEQEGTLEFELEVHTPSAHASVFGKYKNPINELFKTINLIETETKSKVNILKIEGGWEYYAVPKYAKALVEVKVKKNEDLRKIKMKIQNVSEARKIKIKFIDQENYLSFFPKELLGILSSAFEKVGIRMKTGVMSSWTDASNFKKAGIESVIVGPGELELSHTEKENIKIKDTQIFSKILYNVFAEIEQR